MSLLAVEDLTVAIHGEPVAAGGIARPRRRRNSRVIGESGSGKSMTALGVAGLLPSGAARRGASCSTASTCSPGPRRRSARSAVATSA